MRKLSIKMGMGSGFLSLVLSGARGLTDEAQVKLLRFLGLNRAEELFFKALRKLDESSLQEDKLEAFRGIQRFRNYKTKSPKESQVYQYLTKWYYVAIREMALQSDFQVDAAWISEQLLFKVSVKEARAALVFLEANGFIKINSDKKVEVPERQIDCFGGVYKLSLTEFYRQMFALAHESIGLVPSEERSVLGHTFSITEDQFGQVRELLKDVQKKIEALGGTDQKGTRVYQIGLQAFPLTSKKQNIKKED